MTKIEEFEKKLISDGISEADYSEYEKLLKKAGDNSLRLQHCYITAIKFPRERCGEAVALIEWGLERFPDTWFPTFTAYQYIGNIYEKSGDYRSAFDAYKKAAGILEKEKNIGQLRVLSGDLLWTLLHIDNFTYSKELEEYYELFNGISDFAKSFVNNEFRLAVAEAVICSYHNDKEKAAAAYEKAVEISKTGRASMKNDALNMHKVKDTLKITPECSSFLKQK